MKAHFPRCGFSQALETRSSHHEGYERHRDAGYGLIHGGASNRRFLHEAETSKDLMLDSQEGRGERELWISSLPKNAEQ